MKGISPSIEILSDEYANNTTKMKCKCGVCEHEWLVSWNALQSGNGCPSCAGRGAYTAEELRGRFPNKNENVEIIGDKKIGSNQKIKCRCKICGKIWDMTPGHLRTGRGCIKCAKKEKLTLDEIKLKLSKISPSITIKSDEYVNSSSNLICSCNECGYEWGAPWNNLQGGSGCNQCAGLLKHELKDIKKELISINPNIEIISKEYENSKTPLTCRCNICSNIWKSRWNDLRKGIGCPECGVKTRSLTLATSIKEIRNRLKEMNPNIEVLSKKREFKDNKIHCVCKMCGCEWHPIVNNLLTKNSGCPECNKTRSSWKIDEWVQSGSKSKNFSSFKLYILKCYNKFEEFYKIGITYSTIEKRYCSSSSMPYKYDVLKIIESKDGRFIWEMEKILLTEHRKANLRYKPLKQFGGSVMECFTDLLSIDELLEDRKESEVKIYDFTE